MQVTVIDYEEFNDTFKCNIDGRVKHIDAETVADACPVTDLLDDLPFDLVGQKFETNNAAFA